MIVNAELINQPYSGQFEERIYDIPSSWNSQYWTWVKFINDDYSEWCGEFRGLKRQVAVSQKHCRTLILTSDYLFMIDSINGELVEYESKPQYDNLTITPSGDFLVADCYGIELIKDTLKDKKVIVSPIHMDGISFHEWTGTKLRIGCIEFLNWSNNVELELDNDTLVLTIKKESIKHDII